MLFSIDTFIFYQNARPVSAVADPNTMYIPTKIKRCITSFYVQSKCMLRNNFNVSGFLNISKPFFIFMCILHAHKDGTGYDPNKSSVTNDVF